MRGIVKSCFNNANIYTKLNIENTSSTYSHRIGGVVGVNESTDGPGYIEDVYNIGKITLNNSDIVNTSIICEAGGICGLNGERAQIVTVYNIGDIYNFNKENWILLGSVVGNDHSGIAYAKLTNGYYLKNTINANNSGNESINSLGTEKTSEEMRTQSFVDTLNGTDSNWKRDLNNINNGYPIFNWQ